jgi:predicted NUDIX family phosphoesterase
VDGPDNGNHVGRKRRMSLVDTEKVLVVPTELFHELGYFQGFTEEVNLYIDKLFSPENTSYRPRSEMEQDPSFKQLIPYVIFKYVNEDGEVSIFQYTRGNGQGEKRLHAKRSIGVGGHISSDDAEANLDPYREGMRRELEEEVAINCKYEDQCVGMINDDETEVGKVHLGVVHVFTVESPDVSPREDDISEAGFLQLSEIRENLEHFESWSQIALKAIFND